MDMTDQLKSALEGVRSQYNKSNMNNTMSHSDLKKAPGNAI